MLHGAGIFTYIWVIFRAHVNVDKCSIYGAYGKIMGINRSTNPFMMICLLGISWDITGEITKNGSSRTN
jgi:hypothetical protein